MSYELHEEYSCDFTGGPMDPKGFAIHWWGDPATSPNFWGIVNVLLTRSQQRSASVNFVAEAGIVACLVDPFTVAWAQGDGATGWGNLNLVSIECNPRCSAGDRETVAELIADQHIRNGIPIRLYPHKSFTATQCPGVWEQHIPWLVARANQIVAEKTAAPAPAPAPAPVPADPAPSPVTPNRDPNQEINWLVEPGDTLGKIADYYGGPTVAEIAAYNGISDPNRISVGQRIFIPGPLAWIVDPGDTLGKIAAYYGLSADVVAANNGISDPDRISVGQVIWIIPETR
jgi:N-acetylmuramoyl-L-alanine amidase